MLGSPPQLPARQTPGAGGQQYLDSGPLVLHGWRTPARRLMSAAGATAARQDERSIHRHQQQRLAGRRQQRSPVVRGRVRRRPGTIEVPKPTGVPLTSPQARCLLENPKMMVGWEVMLASGGATSGRVRSVSGSQQTATLLKVYGPGWGCKAGPGKGCTSESSSVHLIPFADNIVQRVDLAGKRLVIQPPEVCLHVSIPNEPITLHLQQDLTRAFCLLPGTSSCLAFAVCLPSTSCLPFAGCQVIEVLRQAA